MLEVPPSKFSLYALELMHRSNGIRYQSSNPCDLSSHLRFCWALLQEVVVQIYCISDHIISSAPIFVPMHTVTAESFIRVTIHLAKVPPFLSCKVALCEALLCVIYAVCMREIRTNI